jgi:hypothetical protein
MRSDQSEGLSRAVDTMNVIISLMEDGDGPLGGVSHSSFLNLTSLFIYFL